MISQERPQIALQRVRWNKNEIVKLADQKEGLALAVILLPGDDNQGPCVVLNLKNLAEGYDEDLTTSGVDITFYPNSYEAYLELYDLAEDWAIENHPDLATQLLNDVIIWATDDNSENFFILDSAGNAIHEPYDEYFLEILDGLWNICTEYNMQHIISTILYMSSNEELQKLLAAINTDTTLSYKSYDGADTNPYLPSDDSEEEYQNN